MSDFILVLHLVGVALLVVGIARVGVAYTDARRRQSAREIADLLGRARRAIPLVAAGAVLTPACGLWLVHLRHFRYGAGWIQAALALYVVALVLGGLGGQRPKQARLLAGRLAAHDEPITQELRALLDDQGTRIANYVSTILMLVVLVLMFAQP
ncbi:MAG TPA: DUF2269 family protein [Solirubrobacteraceae bacterium]|jgi:uncharacterized membrane protein|nr:DUF2269 family protein [Solirubrobacteraceae bacterium]